MGMLLRAVLTSLAALGTDAMRPLRPPQALAIAPATEPAALAALSLLRQLCATSEFSNLQVRAICGDSKQEVACRQAICGALCCQGRTRDMCTDRFPTLQTYAALTDAGSVQIRKRRMQAALQGVDTLVILRDDIHPRAPRCRHRPRPAVRARPGGPCAATLELGDHLQPCALPDAY